MMAVDTLVGYKDLRLLVDVDPPEYDDYEDFQYRPQGADVSPRRLSRSNTKESLSQNAKANKTVSRQNTKTEREFSDVSQDGAGDQHQGQVAEEKTAAKGKKKAPLEAVTEDVMQFDDEFDIKSEEAWTGFPATHIPGRFAQYRDLARKRVDYLESQMDGVIKKTSRKIQTVKAQFLEHKKKWEAERGILVKQIEQAHEFQNEAEKEADTAMNQLEEFIKEQEELEVDEKEKMKVLELQVSQPEMSMADAIATVTQQKQQEQADADRQRLLSQTDDAKAQMTGNDQMEGEDRLSLEKEESKNSLDVTSHLDEIRASSARSRASLRDQHRNALSALRANQDSRLKVRSPSVLSIKSQLSNLSDAELDEDGDMPFPPDKGREEDARDAGTSPMALKPEKTSDTINTKTNIPMSDHPIVIEYLKTYDGLVNLKDAISKALIDKDMMSAGQVLSDIDTVVFEKDRKVQPQIEQMTRNIQTILEETFSVLTSLLYNDRDFPVSSLFNVSRDPTRSVYTRERSQDTDYHHVTQGSKSRGSSRGEYLKDLQQQYFMLQRMFEDEKAKHDLQLNRNTVIMMEMQDTINRLQRELASLGHKTEGLVQTRQPTPPQSPVMFSRLDSDRNSKIMKRAVNEKKLDAAKYANTVDTMKKYVDLPAKRLVHMVNKYAHHVQMREIEENVRNNTNLDDDVLIALEKMESLQNQRARKWAEKMDRMGVERLRLANLLMDALTNIEQESGIFLIKPMFSYNGTSNPDRFQGKISRSSYRGQRTAENVLTPMENGRGTAWAPVNTPASNFRLIKQPPVEPEPEETRDLGRVENIEDGISGKTAQLIGGYQRPMWNPTMAQPKHLSPSNEALFRSNQHNTPKILEMDINRMLIGQNQISMTIPPNFSSGDRLANAANSSVRSYITVNRPAGQTSLNKSDRPRSTTDIPDVAPPASPLRQHSPGTRSSRARQSEGGTPRSTHSRNLPSTPPLPPIIPGLANERSDSSGSGIIRVLTS